MPALRVTPLEIPEWGGTVLLRDLTGTERDALERGQWSLKTAALIAKMLVDAQGTRLFDDDELDAVGEIPASVARRILAAALRNAGIGEELSAVVARLRRDHWRRFLFRLALQLGCTVAELLERCSSSELTEWQGMAQLDPWGEERADLRSGIIAATVANVNRSKGKTPYKPAEFMPQFDPQQEEQTVEQQLAIVELLNAAFGGEDVRPELVPRD